MKQRRIKDPLKAVQWIKARVNKPGLKPELRQRMKRAASLLEQTLKLRKD